MSTIVDRDRWMASDPFSKELKTRIENTYFHPDMHGHLHGPNIIIDTKQPELNGKESASYMRDPPKVSQPELVTIPQCFKLAICFECLKSYVWSSETLNNEIPHS